MSISSHEINKFIITTFILDEQLYGFEVDQVQEVIAQPKIYSIPLAPRFLLGLINLRGQIATAVSLHKLFGNEGRETENSMAVVCHGNGQPISFLVDQVGEVTEVTQDKFEECPDTIPTTIRKYLTGIYKIDGKLLSLVNLDIIMKELNLENENASTINTQVG